MRPFHNVHNVVCIYCIYNDRIVIVFHFILFCLFTLSSLIFIFSKILAIQSYSVNSRINKVYVCMYVCMYVGMYVCQNQASNSEFN